MTSKSFLCLADELEEGQFLEARLTGAEQAPQYLILTRCQGQPMAWLNVCPHQGRALNFAPNRFLTDGQGRLVCAHHGAVFEADSGQCVSGPCRGAALKPITVREHQGQILAAD